MRPTRRSIVIGLDMLAAGLVILAGAIARIGGFAFRVHGIRVSVATPQRTLAWLCVVIAIRFIVGRRVGPFGRWDDRWQRMLDSIGDDPFLVRAPARIWRRAGFAALGMAAALALLLHDQLQHLYSVPDLGARL